MKSLFALLCVMFAQQASAGAVSELLKAVSIGTYQGTNATGDKACSIKIERVSDTVSLTLTMGAEVKNHIVQDGQRFYTSSPLLFHYMEWLDEPVEHRRTFEIFEGDENGDEYRIVTIADFGYWGPNGSGLLSYLTCAYQK